VLAAAGLARLGLTNRVSRFFTPSEILPAAGQGALVLQGRAGEDYSCLEGFDHLAVRQAVTAERACLAALGGGCATPGAAYAEIEGEELVLTALYVDAAGYSFRLTVKGCPASAGELGESLAARLLAGEGRE
jgi:porphobilinogen deaminase